MAGVLLYNSVAWVSKPQRPITLLGIVSFRDAYLCQRVLGLRSSTPPLRATLTKGYWVFDSAVLPVSTSKVRVLQATRRPMIYVVFTISVHPIRLVVSTSCALPKRGDISL